MKIGVNAACRCAGQRDVLHEQARKLASRKILRFLDSASLAPFVAAATLYRHDPVAAPEDVALYTMGGWDPDTPDQVMTTADGTAESDARLSRRILEDADPLGWLRLMSNNALCQTAIAERFRGPNAHLVGGPDVLARVLAVAAADLRRGSARQALVIAYDTAPEDRHNPSDRARASAAGLSLASAETGEDAMPALSAMARSAAGSCDSALDVMRAYIGTLTDPDPVEIGPR